MMQEGDPRDTKTTIGGKLLFWMIFVRERFIEKKKKEQTNVCFALTPTYVQQKLTLFLFFL